MTLKEKHLSEQNKMASNVAIIILASMLALTLLAVLTAGVKVKLIARGAIILISMLLIIFTRKKMLVKASYYHIINISTFVSYVITIFTFEDTYIYVYVYAIAMMIMIYRNAKLILASGSLAAVTNLVYFIYFNSANPEKALSTNAVFVNVALIVIATLSAYRIIALQEKQNKENSDMIEEQAKQQNIVADEIVKHAGKLGEEFNTAIDLSNTLTNSMNTSHMAISEIADSTKQTAEAISKQTEQTFEIQNNIQTVDKETREMADISVTTKNTVSEGVELIEELQKKSIVVAQISHETEQATKDLNESIQEVNEITDTILGISSQTNLLALNASIEAARAGEAGKGFAVVADEIRKLSEDTKNATEEICTIITRLTEDAEEASNKMSTSATYAEEQNAMIQTTGNKLEEIKSNSEQLFKHVDAVSKSVAEILAANSAISDSISDLSASSEEVVASTGSTLAISNDNMKALESMNIALQSIHEISETMVQLTKKD